MELDYIKIKDIKPLLSEYLRETEILLNASRMPDEKTVHDVRVFMKKARALLKLLSVESVEYTEKNIADLREAGRMLSSWRDTSVQRKTLKEFRKKYPEVFSRLADNEILNSILQKEPEGTEPEPAQITELEKINNCVNKTNYRVRFQAMDNIEPQQLLQKLDDTFLNVQNVYVSCRNTLKPKSLHKFRKRIKDFLYQVNIFRSLNSSKIKSLEKKLDSMASNLGKFNDIEHIIKALKYDFRNENNNPAFDELIIILRYAQDDYLAKVWPSAYKLFCPGQKLINILGFKLIII